MAWPTPTWPARGWPGQTTSPTGSPRPAAGDPTSASPSTAPWPLVLTGYVEGDVIRHTETFALLRALDLPAGHTVTVLDEMGICEDESEPSSERWLAER
ncbi:hypothetical protein ACWCRC_40700, partial [Streptomyces sp. NPDC001940]